MFSQGPPEGPYPKISGFRKRLQLYIPAILHKETLICKKILELFFKEAEFTTTKHSSLFVHVYYFLHNKVAL